MEFKDYYQALGVDRDATADQIKTAFRKLARKYHPDVSKEADAEARMREVNEAYAALSDPEKRAAYDALASGQRAGQEFRPPPDWDAGFEFSGRGAHAADAADFSDFFAQMFGRGRGARASHGGDAFGAGDPFGAREEFAARGNDSHARIVLDLEDAWRGARRTITLRAPRLDAQGRVRLESRALEVQIPRGVREGQLIRLAGQGAPGAGGAPAGDLYLEVHLRPHPRFAVDGRNLLAELPAAPWEAALGGVVPVRLPDGTDLKVRLPAGAQSGRVLVVRGKGLPGEPPGDLELTVRVVLPPADTARARELYETMARELAFDPRAAQESPSDA